MTEPIDQELQRMASGNPEVARAIRADLETLAKRGNPELAEMARDLLAGRIDLRTVGQSSAYGAPLTEAFGAFQRWQSELSAEERAELEDQAQERFGSEQRGD